MISAHMSVPKLSAKYLMLLVLLGLWALMAAWAVNRMIGRQSWAGNVRLASPLGLGFGVKFYPNQTKTKPDDDGDVPWKT
jgi:hypothetical protein